MLQHMRRFLFLAVFLFTCGGEPLETRSTHNNTTQQVFHLDVSRLVRPHVEKPTKSAVPKDPYSGWHQWCEPVEYDVVCQDDSDCKEVKAVAVGRSLKCIRPWWARNEEVKVCAPGYARKNERNWRRKRLRRIVREQYFGEADLCQEGIPMHHQGWRCQRAWKRGEDLTKFLWAIYKRETTGRPWKRHRLNPDLDANLQAWVRRASRYGWEVEVGCVDGRSRCKKSKKVILDYRPVGENANPHYGDRSRWQYGLGAFGQNAALWVDLWDSQAPPEILCREVPAVESYLRRARHAVRVLKSGVDCDGDGLKEHYGDPSWISLHAAVSGGQVCPGRRSQAMDEKFRSRLLKEGLDPDAKVTVELLGEPIPQESQNERVRELEGMLSTALPHPEGASWH